MFRFRTFIISSITFISIFPPSFGQPELCEFIRPVKHNIISSGSFGEPRSAHFHSGIDIKPHKGEGIDELVAIADGYISRIRMTPDGYGKALYIDHSCGYTSVYAHMDRFVPKFAEYIDRVRIASKQSEIDQKPPQNALVVKKGDVLGYLGNSGNSFGAHLHFEIRNTITEVAINPVLFGIGPKDNISPIIKGVFMYSLDGNRTVFDKKYFPAFKNKEGIYELKNGLLEPGWPLIGIGLHVYDLSNGAGNHNGIYSAEIIINNQKEFGFSMDSIPFDKSHFLHCHMDYEEKKNNKYVHKCYSEPLNELQIYALNGKNGLIIPNEIIPDLISIETKDSFGNSSLLNFKVVRKPINKIIWQISQNKLLVLPDDSTSFIINKCVIDISPKTFLHPTELRIDSVKNGFFISTLKPTPLFQNFTLSTPIQNCSKKHSTKCVFITIDEKQKHVNLGGEIKNGKLICNHNSLGKLYSAIDTIPPTIEYLANSGREFYRFRIKDNFKTKGKYTRLKYKAHVSGKWVPLNYDEKNDLLEYRRRESDEKSEFVLELMDFSGNTVRFTKIL